MKAAFFFDWDGTLADSMDLCLAEIRQTLTQMNLPIPTEATLRRCNGPTYADSVAILGIPPERAEEYCDVRLQAEMALCPTVSHLYPGVREMLLRLREHAALCVVTNGLEKYLQLSLESFGVADLFDRTATYRPGRTKPDALAELVAELQPERCVMIGDRIGDILAGKACHMPTVACRYGCGSQEDWAQADHCVDTVEELEQLLMRMLA